MDTTRRTFLSQGAGALGLLFLSSLTPELIAQAHKHAQSSANAAEPHAFKFLTQQEAADFDAFAAQIIPSDGTPGAREAGAVYFVDYVLTNINPEQQKDFRGAMGRLHNAAIQAQPGVASFAALPSEKQIEVMTRMEKPPGADAAGPNPFADPVHNGGSPDTQAFGLLRATVITGTFCDPSLGGNRDQIGWKLIKFDNQAYWAPPFGYYDAHAEEKA